MSVATGRAMVQPAAAPPRRRSNARTWLWGATALIVLLSFVRVVTGADDITSSGTVEAALRLAVPIGMAGLGGLWAERSGVVNIGLEGMLILGTWFGAWGAYTFGPWQGVAIGIVGGALGGLLHAFATVTFGVDHIVSGVAINILGAGVTRYLSAIFFEGEPGGGVTQSPRLPSIGTVTLPFLSDWLGDLHAKGWFLISDVAGILRGLSTDVSYLTIFCILLIPLTYVVLWRTAFGLRVRSCGENPYAAESLGVNVYRMKYAAVVISGGCAGLGGAFLAIVSSSIYREGQTTGRGFIGLAAMIFGNWRPGGLALGSGLFGYADALQLRPAGGESVHALLLVLVIALVGYAFWCARQGDRVAAIYSVVFAGVIAVWFAMTSTIPEQFVSFAPHLTTLFVLALASQRLRPPAYDGIPFRRGDAP